MTVEYDADALQEQHDESVATANGDADLAGFKSGGVNFKLTLWDPKHNGVRYLKALTFCLAARLRPVDRERLRRIRHRDVGDPITVRYDGEQICMDYLRAVLEVDFIAGSLDLDGKRVVEVGAGYGRTCHAIMSNYDVAGYHIVERDDMLRLSREYLRAVLDDDQFAKLSFHPVSDLGDTFPGEADLCVNIDSFMVMEPSTVRDYLSLIDERCRHFYVNGPVGKYQDKNLDNHSQGADLVAKAMSSGLLRDVLDIYDDQAVAAHSAAFVAAYLPGKRWECAADATTSVWSHYWQAMYRKAR
jgi:putative sugar O-methyltransferase